MLKNLSARDQGALFKLGMDRNHFRAVNNVNVIHPIDAEDRRHEQGTRFDCAHAQVFWATSFQSKLRI